MKDLSSAKILKYDSMLEEITLFSFQDFAYADDGLYYIHKTKLSGLSGRATSRYKTSRRFYLSALKL